MQRNCSQLAGFFGSNFWERIVPQSAHYQSAIRHAVIALDSIHELSERKTTILDVDKAFALEQYNFVIRDLLVPLSRNEKRDVDVCLIACILIASFEVLGSKNPINSYASPEVLARIYAGLDRECTTVRGFLDEHYEPLFYDGSLPGTTNHDTPLLFCNVEEAKNVFEYGCYLFQHFCATQHGPQSPCDPVNLPVHIKTRIDQVIAYFEALHSRYSHELEDFIQSKGSSITPQENVATAVLQLHVLDN
ncbi:hypothetical protein EYC80_003008 [Monilinia laxa]|uniref:Uncharacterized protein n=1 Tax=Monilinia laxa TaxID=61186 RepID=A0A5N6KCH2_MONLA|nr:hypothetical protein EYC80_003008 [Monilinia laxa]